MNENNSFVEYINNYFVEYINNSLNQNNYFGKYINNSLNQNNCFVEYINNYFVEYIIRQIKIIISLNNYFVEHIKLFRWILQHLINHNCKIIKKLDCEIFRILFRKFSGNTWAIIYQCFFNLHYCTFKGSKRESTSSQ